MMTTITTLMIRQQPWLSLSPWWQILHWVGRKLSPFSLGQRRSQAGNIAAHGPGLRKPQGLGYTGQEGWLMGFWLQRGGKSFPVSLVLTENKVRVPGFSYKW